MIIWLLLYSLLAVNLIFQRNWKGLVVLGCLGGGRSLIWIYLIYRGRFPERISVSLYIIELFLLAGMLSNLLQSNKSKWVLVVKGMLVAAVIGILFIQVEETYIKVEEKVQIQREWTVLKDYCEKEKENLYLVDVFSAVEYGGLQYERDGNNMMLAGGWMSASPSALKRLADRGASDGAEVLYGDTKTLFLADKTRNLEDMKAYLHKRFGDCNLELVDEILCSEDKIFAVYRLIH